MRNTITLRYLDGRPKTGCAVAAYEWQSGAPYYGSLIGAFSEISGTGQYYLDLTGTVRATILIDSVREEAWTKVVLFGDFGTDFLPDGTVDTDQLVDGAVTTAKIEDGAVTPVKTSFAEDF